MTDFDPARIVPSLRDLAAGLAMRRKSLALVPLVQDAAVDGVRALAFAGADALMQRLTAGVRDVPALCLAPCRTAVDCQRARFFGADGVCIAGDYGALAKVARSMRMMPLALVADRDGAVAADRDGARAILLRADDDPAGAAAAVAAALPKIVLVADWSRAAPAADGSWPWPTPDALRSLRGTADAVVLPPRFDRRADFAALAEELDD